MIADGFWHFARKGGPLLFYTFDVYRKREDGSLYRVWFTDYVTYVVLPQRRD
jgi:hypothetical protein